MQQQIGFCSTTDGARIAYATVGTGPALIFAQPFSHLVLEWEEPRVRDFWERVGRHHMVVRYDTHGCGLSDRNRSDFSLGAEIRFIEAIVKDLELKSFALWARSYASFWVHRLRGEVSRACLSFDLVRCADPVARHSCLGRPKSRDLDRYGAVKLANVPAVPAFGGRDDAREHTRCCCAAMVPQHAARRCDGRNGRSVRDTLVEDGRPGLAPEGQRANAGRPLPQRSVGAVRSRMRSSCGNPRRSARALGG